VGAARRGELFVRARGFLMPIRWAEPFGMVMAEALACGPPVIAASRYEAAIGEGYEAAYRRGRHGRALSACQHVRMPLTVTSAAKRARGSPERTLSLR
jgi:hypothetical protein